MRSFKVETPVAAVRPLVRDLDGVPRFRTFSSFEPLYSPLRILMKMVLFFVTLATAKNVGSCRQSLVVFHLLRLTCGFRSRFLS